MLRRAAPHPIPEGKYIKWHIHDFKGMLKQIHISLLNLHLFIDLLIATIHTRERCIGAGDGVGGEHNMIPTLPSSVHSYPSPVLTHAQRTSRLLPR